MARYTGSKEMPYTLDHAQIEVARRSSYSPTQISIQERGKGKATMDFVDAVSNALTLTPKTLLKEYQLPLLDAPQKEAPNSEVALDPDLINRMLTGNSRIVLEVDPSDPASLASVMAVCSYVWFRRHAK